MAPPGKPAAAILPDVNWPHLAETVIRHRKRRGWRQHNLAERSGMSVRTIRRLEAGREPVSEATMLAVEAALSWQYGSAVRVLAGGKPVRETDDDLTAVLELWSRLSPEVRRMIRMMAEESAR